VSVSASLTVADSKRAFHSAFPHVIAPLYRRLVDELLVELHLLSHQQGFQADGLFAVGLTQVFDSFSNGYRPDTQREPLFQALCSATGFDATGLRRQAEEARSGVGHHSLDEVKGWLSNRGEGAPDPIAGLLQGVQRSDFHYSRLVAVGLLSLLQGAQGAEALEPQALRSAAREIGEAMGLIKDRVDKDLSLYAGNIEKMSQAVELMEETVAAERRRRERAEQERLGQSSSGAASEPSTGSDGSAPA